jgi:hypothetical protein
MKTQKEIERDEEIDRLLIEWGHPSAPHRGPPSLPIAHQLDAPTPEVQAEAAWLLAQYAASTNDEDRALFTAEMARLTGLL